MSAAKFEKLIELIINEDKARAEQLFHEIVVEKSREIYESLMTEDPTQDLMDEIENEEQGMHGMTEADDDFETDEVIAGDYDTEGDDDMEDMDDMEDEEAMDDMEDEEAMDDMEDEEGMEDEELEDRVVDLEDKIDDLIARFEAEMGADEEMDGEEEEEEGEDEEEEGEEEESGLMEEVQLKKVSVTHGDNGAQTKSPGLQNPSRVQTGGAPVKFSGQHESVPTSPKAPSGHATKDLPGAGNFKNAPGKDNFKEKGEAAPKAKHEDPGKSKSPVAVAEGRTKRKAK